MKKKKEIAILLSTVLFATSVNLTSVLALGNDGSNNTVINVSDSKLIETEKGFKLSYEQIEDGRCVYYDEELVDNIVYTKKYEKNNNGDLTLIGELTTTIVVEEKDTKVSGYVTINDITNGNVTTEIFEDNIENSVQPKLEPGTSGSKTHPTDKTYTFNHASTGHKGIDNMTKAAVAGVVATIITGGRIVAGAAASVATAFISGGWSNLYYYKATYYPNPRLGKTKGKPIWKSVTNFYANSKRTQRVGPVCYTEATVLSKN